jgi:hypothetical protein
VFVGVAVTVGSNVFVGVGLAGIELLAVSPALLAAPVPVLFPELPPEFPPEFPLEFPTGFPPEFPDELFPVLRGAFKLLEFPPVLAGFFGALIRSNA